MYHNTAQELEWPRAGKMPLGSCSQGGWGSVALVLNWHCKKEDEVISSA